jgi:hypothetical protein
VGGLIMMNSVKKYKSVWCGAALLRRPGLAECSSHSRVSAQV